VIDDGSDADDTTDPHPAAGSAPTAGPVPDERGGEQGFLWQLTPTDDPDPLVHGGSNDADAQQPQVPNEPASPAPTTTPDASTEQLAAGEQAVTDESAAAEHPTLDEQPLTRRAAREAAARQAAQAGPAAAAEPADDPLTTAPYGAATGATGATGAVTTPVRAAPASGAGGIGPLVASDAATDQAAAADPGSANAARTASKGGGRRMERSTRILMFAAGGLLLVLLLILLFVLGTRMSAGSSQPVSTPTASATHTPTATPTPTPTAPPTPKDPAAVGTHAWDALGGGECLQPFTSPWAQNFTVVACTTPHTAQLVLRGSFTTDPTAAYPGAQELASQINTLCMKPGVINLSAASAFDDIQVQGSYPASTEQWTSGQRSYFCFVSRSSGKSITGSLAG